MGEALPSAEAVKKLVRKIATNYKLPYFTLTPTFSICPKHGYLVGEYKFCPKCDEELGYTTETIKSETINIEPDKYDEDDIERNIIESLA